MLIRRAIQDDCDDLFAWRNHPETRSASINNQEISLPEHRQWFEQSLLNPYRFIWIGIEQQQKIGSCRFDIDAHEQLATISINLNPQYFGKGLGTMLLCHAMQQQQQHSSLHRVIALVRADNAASVRLFERNGFTLSEIGELLRYEKSL